MAKDSTSVTRDGVTYADHGTKDVRKLSRLELEADDYYFSPTFLRGAPGQKLTLLVESEASTLHNISIPALGIDQDVPPKGKIQVNVTFPALGRPRLILQVPRGAGDERPAADPGHRLQRGALEANRPRGVSEAGIRDAAGHNLELHVSSLVVC